MSSLCKMLHEPPSSFPLSHRAFFAPSMKEKPTNSLLPIIPEPPSCLPPCHAIHPLCLPSRRRLTNPPFPMLEYRNIGRSRFVSFPLVLSFHERVNYFAPSYLNNIFISLFPQCTCLSNRLGNRGLCVAKPGCF